MPRYGQMPDESIEIRQIKRTKVNNLIWLKMA